MSSKADLACFAAAAVFGLVLIARAKRVESVIEVPVVPAVVPKSCGKKVKAAVRLTLKDDQLAYLQSIVSQRDGSIKDVAHALRILLRFASSSRADLDGIFKVVRCMHCRTQAKNIEVDAEVYEYQLAQLEALRVKYELPDVGKVVRVLLDYAVKDGDETAIFFTPDTCDCGAH